MIVQTQAMKITEESYPAVVACIPHYVDQTVASLEGDYLVINLLTSVQLDEGGSLQTVMVNRVLTKEDFEGEFKFTNGARANRFMPIGRIATPWEARRKKQEKERKTRNKEHGLRGPHYVSYSPNPR